MSYKTILTHLSDSRRAEALLEPAIALATQFSAHLIGLHVSPTVPTPAIAMPYASKVLAQILAEERANSDAIAETVAYMTAGRPIVADWQLPKVAATSIAPTVIERARAVDLVVASQTDPTWDLSGVFDFPERLALESGRPVLVVPYVGRYPTVGRSVVIAWKASRESARAVFDALPLLKAADDVHILEVRETSEPGQTLTADTAIAAALARHGVKPIIHSTTASGLSAGDEILSRISDLGADLLVMGAYGHSRMRELVFGGVTRHIGQHMTVPTLLSH